MNTAFLIILALIIYFAAYWIYGKKISKNLVKVDDSRKTPAVVLNDNIDYVPTNKWVLFGHHFASIAGAAPIIGPAIALAWGWIPAILWIWFGNVFIGMVHDYLSLMASVRKKGKSIAWIAGELTNRGTGYLFSWFIFLTLILIVAAFGAVMGIIFVKEPAVPTAFILFIVAAIIFGLLTYKAKINFALATVIGLILIILSIWIGLVYPIHASFHTWMIAVLVYIVIAAALPVWILMQPRDYLNSYILYFGLAVGGLSLLVIGFSGGGQLLTPGFTTWSAAVVAGKPSPFWPVIPLIIACGSLSGFHSLVSSGTSSKQLDKESSGSLIGAGAMLTEGFLSTIVVGSIAAFGLTVLGKHANALLSSVASFGAHYTGALHFAGGPVGIFTKSYGLAANTGLGLPVHGMEVFAGLWVAAFAMTTLDTCNRLGRFTWAELWAPMKEGSFHDFITSKWIGSLPTAAIGIWLAWGGAWKVIWPAFGGANQTLASIALLTVALWTIKELNATTGYKIAVVAPAFFLWITLTLALIWYLFTVIPVFLHKSAAQGWIISLAVVVMLVLNGVLMYSFLKALRKPSKIAADAT